MSSDERVVFEPAWEDNPTWGGSELYEDLAGAQRFAAEAYVDEQGEMLDGHEDGPGKLVWVEAGESWDLTDGGRPTPVSIVARPVRGRPASAGPAPANLLALAHEFRVLIPNPGVGGYGEVVVRRQPDGAGERWAVTDGAFSGLRAWVDGEGWRYVSDIGRAAAYRHGLEQALELAHQVAEIEAACHQAEVAAVRPENRREDGGG
ncbi:hypothetical protein HYE82_08655 [Streptomyces sp. BR123]|uniref:hypothetical protein n=1 Tax=Streptomyces sp. BR123 TaxID=2749828 RepID=UPI0015C422C7|nr:hypothetical protein [Streptomyces sp. BR123]NXY94461.1 hypothetical protein [Streptomyces sp. BR123]